MSSTGKKPINVKDTTNIPPTKLQAQTLLKSLHTIQKDIGAKSHVAGTLSRVLKNVINGTPTNQLREPLSESEIGELLTQIKNKIDSEF